MDITYSVIMPVFNSEKTVSKAIESVLNNNDSNIELIIVNDGSSDNSEALIKEYLNDPRVSYYLRDKAGVSAARNFGLTVAKGEYISFLDSDDFFKKDTFAQMSTYIDEFKSDMFCFGFYSEMFDNNDMHISTCANTISHIFSSVPENAEECLAYAIKSSKVMFQTVWSKVFKKSIIDDNNLEFDTNLVCYEDMKFVFDYIRCCSSVTFLPDVFYYFCNRGLGGNVLLKRKSNELTSNVSSCFSSFLALADKYNYSDSFRQFMYEQFFADFTYCSKLIFLPQNDISSKERLRMFSDFLNDEMFLYLKDNYFRELKFYKVLYMLHDYKLDYIAYLLYKNQVCK